MKKFLAMACALFLLLSASGCNMLLPNKVERKQPPLIKPSEVKFDLYEVKRGMISEKADGVAIVDSYEIAPLVFKDYGIVVEILVEQDDVVKKGDVVARQLSNNTGNKEYEKLLDEYILLYNELQALINSHIPEDRIRPTREKMAELRKKMTKISDKNNELISPIDGFVTIVRHDRIERGKRGKEVDVMTIVNPDKKIIYYEGNSKLKANASLRLEKLDGTKLNAYVKSVALDETEKTVIQLNVDETNGVGYGEWLDVYKTAEEKENVIIIPKNLIKTYQGRQFVEVLLPDGKKVERVLETGVEDVTMIEITKGLNEGDNIIIR